MTLAYRKGAMNKAESLSWRQYFVPQATFPLLWDGEVPLEAYLPLKSFGIGNG
jgi:hypothetical protein